MVYKHQQFDLLESDRSAIIMNFDKFLLMISEKTKHPPQKNKQKTKKRSNTPQVILVK